MKVLHNRRYAMMALGAAAAVVSIMVEQPAAQQNKPRLNKIIEQLEAGKPAIDAQDWLFIDMEHSPYAIDKLVQQLAVMAKDKDSRGRPRVTPIVRIPQEADEDFRWAVKQVLDIGVYGVVIPHLETRADAVKFVRAARYPPQRYTKTREPLGQRGYGPGAAAKYWGLAVPEYLMRADVWPLNPDGEIFLIGLIESAEGVKNINQILTAPGLSAIMIAPGDLSMSLGVGPWLAGKPFPPETEAAYQTVLKACLAQKNVVCGAADSVKNIPNRIKEGFKVLLSLPLGGTR